MGFLTGAYGKLAAGKLVRQLQVEMTRVQSQLRRATKDIGNMEKSLSSQQRQMEIGLRQQQSVFMKEGMKGKVTMDYDNAMKMTSKEATFMAALQNEAQSNYAQAQAMWANEFEMFRDGQLEPLKNLEDALQTEKDNLESRVKIAQAEYDAKKEEEKAGVKGLTPEYTGQA